LRSRYLLNNFNKSLVSHADNSIPCSSNPVIGRMNSVSNIAPYFIQIHLNIITQCKPNNSSRLLNQVVLVSHCCNVPNHICRQVYIIIIYRAYVYRQTVSISSTMYLAAIEEKQTSQHTSKLLLGQNALSYVHPLLLITINVTS
jgi:hypothetical protein